MRNRGATAAVALTFGITALIGFWIPASAGTPDAYVDPYRTRFYPRVKDGYRDKVSFDLFADTSLAGSCFDTNDLWIERVGGGTVASWETEDLGTCTDFYDAWATWDGRRDNGERVAVGRYRILSTWSDGEFVVAQASAIVEVATGYRTITRRVAKYGREFATRSTSGNCNWLPQIDRAIQATCLGGSALATWRFLIPKGFRVAGVNVHRERGIVPCRGDRVSRLTKRRTLLVTFGVRSEGWSQCIVYGPTVRFKNRVRI
jgi:hypothetical protein